MTKLFDCTIRDGGHLTGWNFPVDCVKEAYDCAAKSGVDYFEIGYRFDNPKSEWGDFARCEDEFLFSNFKKDENCKISLMIDAGKCSVDKFKECKPELTLIDTVRVATYPDKLDIAFELCEGLSNLGYEVFINFMAISRYKEEDFNKIACWENKNCVKGTCFADSFGSFSPKDVIFYKDKLVSFGYKNICFHAHNNLQLAYINSIEAVKNNFYSIDSSIYGMGRGAGLLPLELILEYFSKTNKKYNSTFYIKIIDKYFKRIKSENPYGYSLEALIGGIKNIHPYYVKELFKNKDLSIEGILKASDLIKEKAPISFNKEIMDELLDSLCVLK